MGTISVQNLLSLGAETDQICPACEGAVVLFGGADAGYVECSCGSVLVLA